MNVTIVHNFVSLSVTYEICAPHYSFEHRLVHNCAVIYIFKYTYIFIVIHHVLVHMFVHTYMSMYMFSHLSIYITHKHHVYIRIDLRLLSRCSMMFCFCSLLHHDSMIFLPHATPESAWCDRCLLITKRPKAPSHYNYLIRVLFYIPYMGLNGVQFCDCSCSCVYCDFEFLKFVFSTLRSRSCFKFN